MKSRISFAPIAIIFLSLLVIDSTDGYSLELSDEPEIEELPSVAELYLNSKPEGASVYVDGELRGKTPCTVKIDVGIGGERTVLVELSMKGSLTKRARVKLVAGKRVEWSEIQIEELNSAKQKLPIKTLCCAIGIGIEKPGGFYLDDVLRSYSINLNTSIDMGPKLGLHMVGLELRRYNFDVYDKWYQYNFDWFYRLKLKKAILPLSLFLGPSIFYDYRFIDNSRTGIATSIGMVWSGTSTGRDVLFGAGILGQRRILIYPFELVGHARLRYFPIGKQYLSDNIPDVLEVSRSEKRQRFDFTLQFEAITPISSVAHVKIGCELITWREYREPDYAGWADWRRTLNLKLGGGLGF